MKYCINCVLFVLLIFFSIDNHAQHCVFDGGYILVIHLSDQDNNPVVLPEDSIILIENNFSESDSCQFSNQAIYLPFGKHSDILSKPNWTYWENKVKEMLVNTRSDDERLATPLFSIVLNGVLAE